MRETRAFARVPRATGTPAVHHPQRRAVDTIRPQFDIPQRVLLPAPIKKADGGAIVGDVVILARVTDFRGMHRNWAWRPDYDDDVDRITCLIIHVCATKVRWTLQHLYYLVAKLRLAY